MSKSPQIDILLLRRLHPKWTTEQLALLPDGIRETLASHILLEFKYTESFNENALQQALGYDFFYKRHNHLKEQDVQTFLLSAQKPRQETLTRFGYQDKEMQGVYRSQLGLVRKIVLISLNDLSNQAHNAFIKCFASHQREKQNAFNTLKRISLNSFSIELQQFLIGWKQLWFALKGEDMKLKLTPEMVMEMGKEWGEVYLSGMPAEEVLSHFKPQQRLAGLTLQERLAGFKPQEILAGLKPQEVLTVFKPQEILAELKPQELEELADYLNKHKQQKTKD